MAINDYTGLSFGDQDTKAALRQLIARVGSILSGKLNMAVEFEPLPATTATIITDLRLTPLSVLLIEATDAGGATELAGGGMFVDLATNRGAGTCTITHTVAAAGHLFRLVILA